MMKFFTVLLLSLGLVLAPASAHGGIKWPWKSDAKQQSPAKPAKAKSKEIARVERDLQRLETLLASMKTSANLSNKAWK
ncbi:MAG TPA: hypothetical protein VMO47_12750, partial [Rhodothermales bacterium]|nr:hypothetical protein [Rhodothermales bacterium]